MLCKSIHRVKMSQEKRLHLTFDDKVRQQLDELKDRTNATSYAEVVRKGIDLLEKQEAEVES